MLRMCRKCLPETEGEEAYFENLRQYIAALDDTVRVEQEVYEERLLICGSCENLLRGMCRLCGCYVELRAALRVRKCPGIPCRWEQVSQTPAVHGNVPESPAGG